MKVLVIDDDPEVMEALSICFELKWCEACVIPAYEGGKGIELAKADLPDVIVLDLGLPDMGGLVVLRQIREFSDVPIIIFTASPDEHDKLKGLELGADDYINKPFTPTDFLARVKSVLSRCNMSEEQKVSEKQLARRN